MKILFTRIILVLCLSFIALPSFAVDLSSWIEYEKNGKDEVGLVMQESAEVTIREIVNAPWGGYRGFGYFTYTDAGDKFVYNKDDEKLFSDYPCQESATLKFDEGQHVGFFVDHKVGCSIKRFYTLNTLNKCGSDNEIMKDICVDNSMLTLVMWPTSFWGILNGDIFTVEVTPIGAPLPGVAVTMLISGLAGTGAFLKRKF